MTQKIYNLLDLLKTIYFIEKKRRPKKSYLLGKLTEIEYLLHISFLPVLFKSIVASFLVTLL